MKCCPKRRVDMFHEPERDAGSSRWSKASVQPRILLVTNIHVQLACCSTIPNPCLTVITYFLLGTQHIAANFSLVHMYCIFKMVRGQDKTQKGFYCKIQKTVTFLDPHMSHKANLYIKAHLSFTKATQSGLYSTEEKHKKLGMDKINHSRTKKCKQGE